MPTLIAFNGGTQNFNTCCASIAVTSPTYHIIGGNTISAIQDYQTASFGTTDVFTQQGETSATGTASIGCVALYATGITGATSWKVTRASVGVVTHRFYTLQFDDLTGYDRFTANYAYKGLTANAVTANIDITSGVSKYLVAVHHMRVGLRWSAGYSITSGGSLSWSLLANNPSPSPFVTAVAQTIYGLAIPANTTSSAKIIISTTDVANPSWPTIYAFDYSAGAAATPVNPGSGKLDLRGAAPTTTSWPFATAAPAAGKYNLRGYEPTVTSFRTVTVTPGVGNASLHGAAPSASGSSFSTTVPGQGKLNLQGHAVTTTAWKFSTVLPAPGKYNLRGYEPTTASFPFASEAPAAGKYNLRGYAPSTTSWQFSTTTPGVGNVSLRGYAPTTTEISFPTASPATGNLALGGRAVSTTAFVFATASPGVGSMALGGYAPTASNLGGLHSSLKRRWRGPLRGRRRDWLKEDDDDLIKIMLGVK